MMIKSAFATFGVPPFLHKLILLRLRMSSVDNPLEEKYEQFLILLETLCECYDSGDNDILALSISTAIRVLVHDTNKSTSLLSHLNRKDIVYLSTNFESDKYPTHLGLVRRINSGVKDGKGGEAKYWPLCDERYFPSPKEHKFISFEQWWCKDKVFCSGQFKLTRKDLVLSLTNKDGGAHFDTAVEEKYDAFRHTWSGGSTLVGIKSSICRGYDNIPIYPAIRQIGHELISTLKR